MSNEGRINVLLWYRLVGVLSGCFSGVKLLDHGRERRVWRLVRVGGGEVFPRCFDAEVVACISVVCGSRGGSGGHRSWRFDGVPRHGLVVAVS